MLLVVRVLKGLVLGDPLLEHKLQVLGLACFLLLWRQLAEHLGRGKLLETERVPVDRVEERVCFQLFHRGPLLGVLVKHFHQDVPGILGEVLWDLEFALLDILVELLNVLVVVRRDPDQHFVQDYADLVDIAGLGDPSPTQHLWREVGGTAAERDCDLFMVFIALLGQPEISQSDMSLPVNQYVLRFQVSKEDMLTVHILHRQNELSCDKPCERLLNELDTVQLLAQVSILNELHHHMQMVRRLECVFQPEHVRMIECFHDVSLSDCVFNLVVRNEELLLHRLHRVALA